MAAVSQASERKQERERERVSEVYEGQRGNVHSLMGRKSRKTSLSAFRKSGEHVNLFLRRPSRRTNNEASYSLWALDIAVSLFPIQK